MLTRTRCTGKKLTRWQSAIGIAGEFQPADDDLLDYDTIASK